jgi:hypothetical protein
VAVDEDEGEDAGADGTCVLVREVRGHGPTLGVLITSVVDTRQVLNMTKTSGVVGAV